MAEVTAGGSGAAKSGRTGAAPQNIGLAKRLSHNRNWLGLWYMMPAAAFLIIFLAYPLGLGVYLSLTDARIAADDWNYVGLENFWFMLDEQPLSDMGATFANEIGLGWAFEERFSIWGDKQFFDSIFFTIVYTVVASIVKFAIGLYLALLLNNHLPFKAFLRAIVLLPFIVPTVLSAIAFWWIYDANYSILSWSAREIGWFDLSLGEALRGSVETAAGRNAEAFAWATEARLAFLERHDWAFGVEGLFGTSGNFNFLGDAWNARWSLIVANIWRGVPFVAITLLAGLQTVSPSLYEAARIDGASRWQIFRHITFPLLTPIIAVVMTFSVLFTFTDFQLVWAITRGGPVDATHLMATLAYQRGILGGYLGEGAAIATAMIPFLLLAIMVSWFGLQRRKWQQGETDD